MKKLALIAASAFLFATPVFACPHEGGDAKPKTAEKEKAKPEGEKEKKAPETAKDAGKKQPKPAEKKPS